MSENTPVRPVVKDEAFRHEIKPCDRFQRKFSGNFQDREYLSPDLLVKVESGCESVLLESPVLEGLVGFSTGEVDELLENVYGEVVEDWEITAYGNGWAVARY